MIGFKRLAAVLATLALTAVACGAQQSGSQATKTDPGVTQDTITLGATYPVSGTASFYYSVAKGAGAYFEYINNEKGGVNGRKIKYIVVDDAYTPANTPAKARELVQQDKVFLTYGNLGTPTNLAVRDYYNQQKVPQLFVFTGSSVWGADYSKYPWTLGWQPDYVTEGKIYARYITQSEASDKIGVLYQNDQYGKDYLNGLRAGLGDKAAAMITDTATYNANDPVDMSSQVNKLKASGANTFYVAATPAYAANAVTNAVKNGWKPKIYMNNVSGASATWRGVVKGLGASAGVDGMISSTYLKDPLDTAKWGNNAGVKLFRDVMTRYGNGCDPSGADSFCISGMASAFTMVNLLRQAGNDLTRKHVMDLACCALNETDNPLLLPGTVVKTTKTDHFPVQQEQLQRWEQDHWVPFGPVLDARKK
ncbi:MAG TPA: ABC transporter substrate-binding protein [Candidatus Dormibacteraeota bacterium]